MQQAAVQRVNRRIVGRGDHPLVNRIIVPVPFNLASVLTPAAHGVGDVLPGLQGAPQVPDQHHRPVGPSTVLGVGAVACEHQYRIIEHGAIAFGCRLKLLQQARSLRRVVFAISPQDFQPWNLQFRIYGSVADAVHGAGRDPRIIRAEDRAHARGDGHDVGHARNQSRRRDVALGRGDVNHALGGRGGHLGGLSAKRARFLQLGHLPVTLAQCLERPEMVLHQFLLRTGDLRL